MTATATSSNAWLAARARERPHTWSSMTAIDPTSDDQASANALSGQDALLRPRRLRPLGRFPSAARAARAARATRTDSIVDVTVDVSVDVTVGSNV